MRIFITILILLVSFSANALEIVVWEASADMPPVILAVADNETPEQALERYKSSIKANPPLAAMFPSGEVPLDGGRFRPLIRGELKALLIANTATDFEKNNSRVRDFRESFAAEKINSYLLPIAADAGLSANDSRKLRHLLAENFGILVPMGGADINTHLYGEDVGGAMGMNPERDRFEFELIRFYHRSRLGFIFGVCRGLQITAAALKYPLIQDIPSEVPNNVGHRSDTHEHEIELLKTMRGMLATALNESGMADAENPRKVIVNTFHHEAADHRAEIFIQGGDLEIAAQAADGVIEALEFRNGQGLLTQFHPEILKNAFAQKIFNTVVREALRVQRETLVRRGEFRERRAARCAKGSAAPN